MSLKNWAWAEREYATTDRPVGQIARRIGRCVWSVYTHMAAAGIRRTRGGAAAWKARTKKRTRKEAQQAWARAKRARLRRAGVTVERRREERGAVASSRPVAMPELRRFRCPCGLLSTSAVCPNGHTINGWIAA